MSGNISTRSTARRFQHPQRQRLSPWMKYFPNPLNLFYRNQQKSPPNQNADARWPISNKHPAAFASRKAAVVINRDVCPLTLNPLNRRIKKQLNGIQGRDSECRLQPAIPSAEGANLATGETRRISQAKGPCIRIRLWKVSIHRDTDAVNPHKGSSLRIHYRGSAIL